MTNKPFTHFLSAIALLGLTACATTEEQTMSYKQQAVELITSIETGEQKPVSYINPDKYIQHNLNVKDGLAGFGEVMQLLPEGSAKAKVVRAIQDGEFVALHTKYDFFGPKAGFDIFRFKGGKIVEHWDNLQELMPLNPSGRSQLDGAVDIKDLDKTDANKALVHDFVHTILIKGDLAKISQFIGPNTEDYIQHNPHVADGLSGLGQALEALAKQDMPMIFTKNHLVIGEGNFVLAVSEGEFMKQHVAFYDLFRVENGKIVEHWDTIEVIPERGAWQNSNGKFGF